MARKKNTETSETIVNQEQVTTLETSEVQNKQEEVAEETSAVPTEQPVQSSTEGEVQKDVPEQPEVTVSTIPDFADKLLKEYSNYSELYIDNKGGVFPSGTQHNLIEKAILYRNPYYKQ